MPHPRPSKDFTDRSKAMLLLWFTTSVIVCLCMYVRVKFLFWIAVLPFRICPFGFLLVVFWLCRCFKCVLFYLRCLGRNVSGNCIDSWSLPSFLLSKRTSVHTSDTEALFLDLKLSVPNDIISTVFITNGTTFHCFHIVEFPFLNGNVLILHPMVHTVLNWLMLQRRVNKKTA